MKGHDLSLSKLWKRNEILWKCRSRWTKNMAVKLFLKMICEVLFRREKSKKKDHVVISRDDEHFRWKQMINLCRLFSLDEGCDESCFEVYNTFTGLSDSLLKRKATNYWLNKAFRLMSKLTRIKSWIKFDKPRLAKTNNLVTGPGIPSVYPSPLPTSVSGPCWLSSVVSVPLLPLTSCN